MKRIIKFWKINILTIGILFMILTMTSMMILGTLENKECMERNTEKFQDEELAKDICY